ncbi:endonuclease III domain-containing protein [Thiohalorhabdus sp.]|uniref:endonuclease III domain-containing protein n=1 Tax=Thiohalorhabdus sp. TaxID=3094134 RepID=UPI002FC33844
MPTFPSVYDTLYQAFGPQNWWPAETPFEVAVGAVLTQNTAWINVERAIANLKAADCLGPATLHAMDPAELAGLIRPAGYFNIKAQRLQALCRFLLDEADGSLANLTNRDTSALRAQLLGIKGVGEETADSILLYALHRRVFVVDAYTRRIFERLGLLKPGLGYGAIQAAFEGNLPRDRSLFNNYHALIVALGKDYCKPKPRCEACPLQDLCPSAVT